jgi:hypothetical protein
LFSGHSASSKYAHKDIFMVLEMTDARFDAVLALSPLFPPTVVSAALTAAASTAVMIELLSVAVTAVAAAAAVAVVVAATMTLVSNATATQTHGQQSAAIGGPVSNNNSAAISM